MLAKRLAIFSIILSLAVFLPKSVSAQTPGPTCPTGMNQYGTTYLCAKPQAIAFCEGGGVVSTICSLPVVGNIVPGPICASALVAAHSSGFPAWCLERISVAQDPQSFCQEVINPLTGYGIPNVLMNGAVLSQCKASLTQLYNLFPGQKIVQGMINPIYSPDCEGGNGVKTGLGCLSTNPQILVNTILPWAIGIGSGIAFLLGLYGALMIVISAGDPEKMQAGKEMITSAVSGLLIIIFAVFILKFIGVDILQLF